MSVGPPRTRLEQKLRAARLSQRDVLRRFPEQAARLGEGEIFVSERQLKRWLAGGAPTPRAVACRVLEAWFGEPVERLLGPPDEIATLDGAGGDVVAEAGRRSVEHAIDAASALDPSALEHLHAAAQRAARTYLITPPLEMLTGLVQLRDTVYDQLDRTHKPHQQAELYLLAGQVCGLLSSVSRSTSGTPALRRSRPAPRTPTARSSTIRRCVRGPKRCSRTCTSGPDDRNKRSWSHPRPWRRHLPALLEPGCTQFEPGHSRSWALEPRSLQTSALLPVSLTAPASMN